MEPIVLTGCGLGVGWMLGFFQAKAKLAEILQEYIKQDACEKCSVKKELPDIWKRLEDGTDKFTGVEISLAVIKSRLGVTDDIAELRAAIRNLDQRKIEDRP